MIPATTPGVISLERGITAALSALATYSLAVTTRAHLQAQRRAWTVLYAIFAVAMGFATVAVAAGLAGCTDVPTAEPPDAGEGGGPSTSASSSSGTGGSPPEAGPIVCRSTDDCDLRTTNCMGVACDPTGQRTDARSAVLGCYLEPTDLDTPCFVDGMPGACEQVPAPPCGCVSRPPWTCVPTHPFMCTPGVCPDGG